MKADLSKMTPPSFCALTDAEIARLPKDCIRCRDVLPVTTGPSRDGCQMPAGHMGTHSDGRGNTWKYPNEPPPISEITAECGASPLGSVFHCRKPTGHTWQHDDKRGNRWHQRGTYLCGLYHPEVEFASHAEWSEHSKAVHLNATFVEIDSNGVGRSKWWTEIDEVRPHVAQAPSPIVIKNRQMTENERAEFEAQFRRDPPQFAYPVAADPPLTPERFAELVEHAKQERPRVRDVKPAGDGRALAAGELAIRCAACNAKAPQDLNRNARDVTGWALVLFPLSEFVLQWGLRHKESAKLCPPCGEKVAKFIAHLSTPMLHEEDLL